MTRPRAEPPSEEDLNRHTAMAVRDLHRFRWAMVAAAGFALVLAVIGLGVVGVQDRARLARDDRQVTADRNQVTADRGQVRADRAAITVDERRLLGSCRFYADLGTLPINVVPPAKKASETLVRIVVDSRRAWFVQECTGTLPAPAPSLVHWAGVYHLDIPG